LATNAANNEVDCVLGVLRFGERLYARPNELRALLAYLNQFAEALYFFPVTTRASGLHLQSKGGYVSLNFRLLQTTSELALLLKP
jgi:hypothetical protein